MAGEKRSAPEAEELAREETTILLDIMGTTTAHTFIEDTLSQYVREFLKKHIDENWNTEEFKADFAKLKEQAKEDEDKKVDGFVPINGDTDEATKESLIKNILWQMDNNRQTDGLKLLQVHMWKAAHKPLKGHVYDDVPNVFEDWTKSGKKLYTYSSGSVDFQKQILGDSIHGDLSKYISEYFDTEIGPKYETESYKNILKKLNMEASNVLFLTNIVKEAEAAKAAGLSTVLVTRENAKVSEEDNSAFKSIGSFTELSFQTANKRQKLDDKMVDEKKDISMEEKSIASSEPASEPMDTSEDIEVTKENKKADTKTDIKEIESKEEKVMDEVKTPKAAEESAESEKPSEMAKSEEESENLKKRETTMEEKTKSEEKTETSMKTDIPIEEKDVKESTEMAVDKLKENETVVVSDKLKPEVSVDTGKKSEEAVDKSTIAEQKSEIEEKENEDKKKVDEPIPTEKIVEEKTVVTKEDTGKALKGLVENVEGKEKTEKSDTKELIDKEAEKVPEKTVEAEVDTKTVKEEIEGNKQKSDEKETSTLESNPAKVKDNSDVNTIDSEEVRKSVEHSIDESENKENVEKIEEAIKVDNKTETDIEIAEEAKETKENVVEKEETEKVKESEKVKSETEMQIEVESKKLNGTTTNGDPTENVANEKVQSNGISEETEKTKENGNAEESIKLKKTVADGAGEPDVVTPPVVAATS